MGRGFETRAAHPCPTQIWVPPRGPYIDQCYLIPCFPNPIISDLPYTLIYKSHILFLSVVPTDEKGMDMDALDKLMTEHRDKGATEVSEKRPYRSMIYLIPCFHNPTMRNMAPGRTRKKEKIGGGGGETGKGAERGNYYRLVIYLITCFHNPSTHSMALDRTRERGQRRGGRDWGL